MPKARIWSLLVLSCAAYTGNRTKNEHCQGGGANYQNTFAASEALAQLLLSVNPAAALKTPEVRAWEAANVRSTARLVRTYKLGQTNGVADNVLEVIDVARAFKKKQLQTLEGAEARIEWLEGKSDDWMAGDRASDKERILKKISGKWMYNKNTWTIETDGRMLFNGVYSESLLERVIDGSTKLMRVDGWTIDHEGSTMERLRWIRASGGVPIIWRRVVGLPDNFYKVCVVCKSILNSSEILCHQCGTPCDAPLNSKLMKPRSSPHDEKQFSEEFAKVVEAMNASHDLKERMQEGLQKLQVKIQELPLVPDEEYFSRIEHAADSLKSKSEPEEEAHSQDEQDLLEGTVDGDMSKSDTQNEKDLASRWNDLKTWAQSVSPMKKKEERKRSDHNMTDIQIRDTLELINSVQEVSQWMKMRKEMSEESGRDIDDEEFALLLGLEGGASEYAFKVSCYSVNKNRLFEQFKYIPRNLAWKFSGNRGGRQEFNNYLIQGVLGLERAILKYDTSHEDFYFKPYAWVYVYYHMIQLGYESPLVKAPSNFHANKKRFRAAQQELTRVGKLPTAEEIAKLLKMPVDKVIEQQLSKLYVTLIETEDEDEYNALRTQISSEDGIEPDEQADEDEDDPSSSKVMLQQRLEQTLTAVETRVMNLRHGIFEPARSWPEIAKEMEMNVLAAKAVELKAMQKLRNDEELRNYLISRPHGGSRRKRP